MKKKSLLLVLVSLFAMIQGVWADEYPQVLWCWETHTLYFINSETVYEPTGFYNGERIQNVWRRSNVVSSPTDEPAWWSETSGSCTKVVFDESFASVRPTSCRKWFYTFGHLTEIVGIENLNTSEVTDMYGMFQNCHGLTSLDLSGFNTRKVSDMTFMFDYCENLKTIYVSEDWTVAGLSSSRNGRYMFSDCPNLMGEKGTTLAYVRSIDNGPTLPYTYSNYAHIDGGIEDPGYLTRKRDNVALDEAAEGNEDIIAANNGLDRNVTIARTFVPGVWNTLSLPFDLDNFLLKAKFGNDVQVKALASTEIVDDVLYFNFTDVDAIEAGKPYLIQVSAPVESPIQFNGVTISNTPNPYEDENASFIPVLDVTTLDNGNENILFLGADNTLYYPAEDSGDMRGFRAYFVVTGAAQGAKAVMSFDDSLTGVKAIEGESGQDSRAYDLQGRMVSNPTKGVYIVNGKKVVIK